MVTKNSGIIKLHEYQGYGGSSWDTRNLSNFFNYDKPYDFGQTVAKIFSASDRYTNKPLTSLTIARGNFTVIPSDIYTWTVGISDEKLFRVMDFVEGSNTRPGYMNQEFTVVLDEGWMKEPDVIQGEDNNYTLEIVGIPMQVGAFWHYRLRLQTSDPNKFIPQSELAIGKTFKKIGTSVRTEMNDVYGTTQWGTQTRLQSQIGAYAEEFAVTDKVIRKEIAARKSGSFNRAALKEGGQYTGYAALSGVATAISYTDKSGQSKRVEQGMFLTWAEMDLNNRIEMGRELMMTHGEASTRLVADNKYIKRTAPGFRQLVQDGHELYHNGALTLKQLEEFFASIFLHKVPEGNRDIVVSTGTLGAIMFDEMIQRDVQGLLTVDSHYIRQMSGGQEGDLEYGYQFRSYRGKNGIRVRLMMDPLKDDPMYCRRMHPINPIYTIDSARMDIYDLGSSADSLSPGGSNMSMIMEDGVESYFWVSNAVDPMTGVINSGAQVSSAEKGVSCKRETSGSLVIWDTSRIGSIIYEPELI